MIDVWVDTGAGLTVLSSKVAEKCKISMSANRDASTTAATGNSNFIWMSYPFVTCMDSTGKPLLFGFDAGASSSSLHAPILSKTDTTLAIRKNKMLASGGGNVKITSPTFPRMVIFSQGSLLPMVFSVGRN